MDSVTAAGGWKKKRKLTRKQRIKLGFLQEEPGQSGEPSKQGEPGHGKKTQQAGGQTQSRKKNQKARINHSNWLQKQADFRRLVQQGHRPKQAKKIVYLKDCHKCQICFVDLAKNERKEHGASQIHRDAVAFRAQCLFESRHAPTLQELIDKTDKEMAEWIIAKKEKSKQKKKDKKIVNKGSLKKEVVGKEAPVVGVVDMEATNKEAPDIETSNMAAPDGEAPSTEISKMVEPEGEAPSIEISSMVAPNMELSDMEISDVEASDKESSHEGTLKETSNVGASEMRAPDESSDVREPRETSDMKTSDMGAPKTELSVVEAPNMGPQDEGDRKMEASDEGTPNKGELKMEASDMGAPDKESSNNEVPVKKPFDKERFFREVAFIGLEYIVEYLPNEKGQRSYACKLCKEVYSKKAIYFHVQSIQHRIVYLATHHTNIGIGMRFQVISRNKYKHLVGCAQEVEEKFGRKIITTVDKVYVKPDRKDPQERKYRPVTPGRRHTASRDDPRFYRDSEFARLAFAKAVMMERDLIRARGFSRRDLDKRLMAIEGFRRSGVESMNEEVWLRRTRTDERSSTSQEDLMKRRLASDGRYPIIEEDLMMRRRYPMMEEEITMRRRTSDGKYANSQEDLIMRHPSSEGQRTQDDVMEEVGLPHGFRDGRPAMSREGTALHQPGADTQTRRSQEASTMHRDANDGRFAMSQSGDMKRPTPGNLQALAFLKSLENRYSTTVSLTQGHPSAMNQELEALRHAVVMNPYTKGDQGKTFRELKASHANENRGLAKSRWESTEGGIEKRPEQCEVEDIWCNDELYDFLARFVVESKEDVEYLLKVTDAFANALVRHRKHAKDIKMKIQEEKKKLEAENKTRMLEPGGKALENAKQEKQKRAKSPAAGAPVQKQARTDLRSSAKPLFSSASSLTPASSLQVKPLMALSFDSYQPAAPAGVHGQPNQQKGPQGKPAQAQAQQRQMYGSTRHQGFDSTMQPNSNQQTPGPKVNRQDSFSGIGPSFSESRPTSFEQQRPTFNQPRPTMNQPRPTMNQPRPTMNQPRPTMNQPRPTMNQPRPTMNQPRPTMNQPRQTMNQSRTPVNKWRQPFDQSGSSISSPRPAMSESRPPWHEQRSSFDQSRPPMSEPRPRMHNSRQQFESRPAYGDMRLSLNEPRQSLDESKPPEQKQPFNKSGPPEPRPAFSGSRPPEPREILAHEQRRAEARPPFVESRQPYSESRALEPRQPYSESRPSDQRQLYSESRPSEPRQPYSESRPSEPRQPYSESRPWEQRQPYSESRPSEPRQPYSESRPSEPRQPYSESRPWEPRQPYSESRPSEPRQPYSESRLSEQRQPCSESRSLEPRQPYSESKPSEPRQLYSESRPLEQRQPYSESKLSEPRQPYSDTRPPEPRQPYRESRPSEPRQPYSESRPPELKQPYSESRPPEPRQPYKDAQGPEPRQPYKADNGYSQNESYPSSQFGNVGSTGGAGQSYGPVPGRYDGYTDSYGSQGYNYNTSYPSSEQRPSLGAATSNLSEPQSHQPQASMNPAYNMPQGQWSSQMPPRKETYPSGGTGDGTSAGKLPTGYKASQGATKFS